MGAHPVKVCLSAIVRNEAARIERWLTSLAPHIDCWVVCDTGSSDGTPDAIKAFFAHSGRLGTVYHAPFINFSQARNRALEFARSSEYDFDYILLADADMTLVCDGWTFTDLTPAYRLKQIANGLSYWNTRLLRRDVNARYVGPTHEYLDVAAADLHGPYFIDHADGANRPEKYERDIRLLREAVRSDPNDARSWYYLAQSLRDTGDMLGAAACYGRRAELKGWDEEVWSAKLNEARCYRAGA